MKFFLILTVVLGFFAFGNNAKAAEIQLKPNIVICNVVKTLSGPISQAIATLVIIITGYSFFVGKVSIGMLFIVAAGVMFVFGANTIMGWILGLNSAQQKQMCE